MRKQRIALEHDADVAPVRRQPGDVLPVERDAALVGPHQPGHDPQQRGLAAARGTEQRDELAAGHREVDAVEHGGGAEGLGRSRDGQESLAHAQIAISRSQRLIQSPRWAATLAQSIWWIFTSAPRPSGFGTALLVPIEKVGPASLFCSSAPSSSLT